MIIKYSANLLSNNNLSFKETKQLKEALTIFFKDKEKKEIEIDLANPVKDVMKEIKKSRKFKIKIPKPKEINLSFFTLKKIYKKVKGLILRKDNLVEELKDENIDSKILNIPLEDILEEYREKGTNGRF